MEKQQNPSKFIVSWKNSFWIQFSLFNKLPNRKGEKKGVRLPESEPEMFPFELDEPGSLAQKNAKPSNKVAKAGGKAAKSKAR